VKAADNGFQKGASHYRFGLESYTNNLNCCGVIYSYSDTESLNPAPSKADKERAKRYKMIVKNLEKQYKKATVYWNSAPDGKKFVAIRISVQNNCFKYGVADETGQVILEPKYSQCWYCPSINKGVEKIPVEVSWKEKGQSDKHYVKKTMNLWHDEARGTFLATTGDKWEIISHTGSVLAESSEYDVTYYHGYLLFGAEETSREYWPGGIFTEQNDDKVALRIHARETYDPSAPSDAENKKYNPYHVYTTDGKLVVAGTGFLYIDDFDGGTNAFHYGTRDADRQYRSGVYFHGEQPRQIPPYFSSVKFDSERGKWMVRQQRLRDYEDYDPAKHNGINYFDEGERLFYVGGKKPENSHYLENGWEYDDAINFYTQVMQQGDVASRPWSIYYWIAALNNKLGAEMISNNLDVGYLEDLSQNMYDYANKHLDKTKSSLAVCVQTFPQLLALLDAYDKLDTQHLFSEDEVNLRKDLTRNVESSNKCQQRLDAALLTFDERVAKYEKKQAEIAEGARLLAEEQARREQAEAEERARLQQAQAQQQQQQQAANVNFSLQILNMFNQNLQAGMNSSTTRQNTTVNRNATSGGYNSTSSDSGTASSRTKKTVKKQVTCETCHGNKKCNICKGTGKSRATYKNGEHKPCDACNGTGHCYICDGKGYKIRYETE